MSDRAAVPRRDQFTRQLLELFAHKETRPDYLGAVVEILREWSGVRCVGIRVLDEAGNIPYGAYIGFDEEFWRQENGVSVNRDKCICVRAILRRPEEHEKPFTTPAGSIHLNHGGRDLGDLNPEQRKLYRGACGRRGFKSLAVIPIMFHDRPVGAIHLADERPDMVGDDVIEFIESITVVIGEAMRLLSASEDSKPIDPARPEVRLAPAESNRRPS